MCLIANIFPGSKMYFQMFGQLLYILKKVIYIYMVYSYPVWAMALHCVGVCCRRLDDDVLSVFLAMTPHQDDKSFCEMNKYELIYK